MVGFRGGKIVCFVIFGGVSIFFDIRFSIGGEMFVLVGILS